MSLKVGQWSRTARLVLIAIPFAFIGCAGGPSEPSAPVASVDVTGAPAENMLLVGGTVQLNAVARDAGGRVLERDIEWSTSAPIVAMVSDDGLVTAVSAGVALITATSGGEVGAAALAVHVAIPVPAPTGLPSTTTLLGNSLSVTIAPGATTLPALSVGRALLISDDPRVLEATAFTVGPSGIDFAAAVTVEVAIDLSTIAGAKRPGLRLYRVSPPGDVDGLATSSVDLDRGVVLATLPATGTYVVLVPGTPAQLVDAEGASRLVEVGSSVPGIAVIARDAAGNPVPGASIQFSLEGGSGSIEGQSLAVTDIAGRADLPGAWIAGPTKGTYALRASIVGTPLSVTFSATALAPAVAVRIASAPTEGLSGVALAGAIPVELVDADGERAEVNAPVTLSLIDDDGPRGLVAEELAVLGSAIFHGQRIDGPGTYRLVASSPGLESDTTGAITITQQVAALVLTTAPAGAASGVPFSTQPVVELRDHAGLRVIGGTAVVTASAHGTGTLFGTRAVAAVDGVATFTNLAVEGTGTLQLNFVSDGPVNVLSGDLVVAPAPEGVRLLVGGAPVSDANVDQSFGVPLTADLSNSGGADIAALDVTLSWDPTRFEYVDRSMGPWLDGAGNTATITVDESQVATGTIRFSGTTPAATTATFRLGLVILRTLASEGTVETPITAVVNSASNAAAAPVVLTVLPMTVTVHAP